MDMYPKYTSPFGYQTGVGSIDTYGVNHNNFSLRDELEYQTARQRRENQLMQQYNNQGITSNYPQYTTNFWGNNAANNYGFGMTNIADNIANLSQTTPILQQSGQQSSNDSNCYMEFDGRNLGLYNNGNQIGNLDAMSGQLDYQSSQYQNVANNGPIPEGTYYANQNQRQNLTLKDVALKLGEKLGINTNQKSNWSGNPVSWGINRVWLQPDVNTNTYGRSGFSIHGGLAKGSKGCIDIPWQTGKLSNYLDNCQDTVPVYVKYPKNW